MSKRKKSAATTRKPKSKTHRRLKKLIRRPKKLTRINFKRELERGIRVEMEHAGKMRSKSRARAAAKRIAMDHLRETPTYYRKLARCFPGEHRNPPPPGRSHMIVAMPPRRNPNEISPAYRVFGYGKPGRIHAGMMVQIAGTNKRGRVVMPSSQPGYWVLNMGGAHGTPKVVHEDNLITRGKTARNPDAMAESKELQYTPGTKVRNLQALPRGIGAKYLVVIQAPPSDPGAWVAKRWARVKPQLSASEYVLVMGFRNPKATAKRIAMDHLRESPSYYRKLKKYRNPKYSKIRVPKAYEEDKPGKQFWLERVVKLAGSGPKHGYDKRFLQECLAYSMWRAGNGSKKWKDLIYAYESAIARFGPSGRIHAGMEDAFEKRCHTRNPLTLAQARKRLPPGYVLQKVEGEYRVGRRGAPESQYYYTSDLADAVNTARAEAEQKR